MPTVRLSGKTLSANESVERSLRAKLLFLIYNAGWDINNASGKEQITLSNIEKKIIESDCFVFTPGASLEDLFKAVSIFVGYQTIDQNLSGKPTVILNSDASWDPLFDVLSHLGKMGTVKQDLSGVSSLGEFTRGGSCATRFRKGSRTPGRGKGRGR